MGGAVQDLVIWGGGGFGREVLQVALDLNDDQRRWNVLGFLESDPKRVGGVIHDLPILGGAAWLEEHPSVTTVVAIGNTAVRRRIARQLADLGVSRFGALVHPRAWLGRRVVLGPGSIVCAGTSITTDVVVGAHGVLNLHCTVGHDARLEDFVTLAPGVHVSGAVTVGEGCDVGTGAAIIQGVSVGAWSVIGAGAVVIRALPANVTAVGNPARVIKERAPGWHLPQEQSP